jgi:ankyrin repeat protein
MNNLSSSSSRGRFTALMMCTDPKALKMLLEAGADVHKTTDAGNTCLHVAAQYKYSAAVVCMLIKAGVSLSAVNRSGMTAAEVATACGNGLTAALLVRAARD